VADLEKVKVSGGTALCLGGRDAFTTVELFENVLLAQVGADGWQKLTDDKFDWGSKAVTDALGTLDTLLAYADADADEQSWDQAVAKLASGGMRVPDDERLGVWRTRQGRCYRIERRGGGVPGDERWLSRRRRRLRRGDECA
jgi:hypothetical protein